MKRPQVIVTAWHDRIKVVNDFMLEKAFETISVQPSGIIRLTDGIVEYEWAIIIVEYK